MRRAICTALLAAIMALTAVGHGLAAPSETTATPTLDTATRRALELELQIEENRAESISIEERIFV
ncbi:MAG: hypothetical protein U1E22_11050, partial [Coriobacteriia bacterium]|nr:hypothetical protein [Coriobacteriia bacterium]